MAVTKFNDTFLDNAKVPTAGTIMSTAAPAVGARAVGRPSGVIENDGTTKLRANGVVKTAAPPPAYSSGKDHRPAMVQSFVDHTV